MPFKIRLAVVTLVISITVIFSIANSASLYTYYLKTWHIKIKGLDGEKAQKHAELLLQKYEKLLSAKKISERKYLEEERDIKVRAYLDVMVRVFSSDDDRTGNLNNDQKEFCRFAGSYYIDKGEPEKGAQLILSTLDRDLKRDEIVPFEKVIRALYGKRMYSDIVSEMESHTFEPRREFPFWYGISLYKIGRNADAVVQLKKAEAEGIAETDLFYSLALSYQSMKQYHDAITYAEKVLKMNPRDRECRILLVALYNKVGMRKEAERISRRI